VASGEAFCHLFRLSSFFTSFSLFLLSLARRLFCVVFVSVLFHPPLFFAPFRATCPPFSDFPKNLISFPCLSFCGRLNPKSPHTRDYPMQSSSPSRVDRGSARRAPRASTALALALASVAALAPLSRAHAQNADSTGYGPSGVPSVTGFWDPNAAAAALSQRLNEPGPAGPQGPQGAQGPQGPQGPAGSSASLAGAGQPGAHGFVVDVQAGPSSGAPCGGFVVRYSDGSSAVQMPSAGCDWN
jgi:hypothetical protein